MQNNIINIPIMEINEDVLEQIILEVERKIPENIRKKVESPAMRKQLLEKCGEKAFLFPQQLKFPVINPDTCEYDCNLVYSAYLRANQHKDRFPQYVAVAEKARKIFKLMKCDNSIGIKLEGQETIDIESFVYLFLD